jgi:HSP20 family protein
MSTELQKQSQGTLASAPAYRRPYYRVSGDKAAYSVEVFMPGVAKEDYAISLQGDELLVEGRKVLPVKAGAKWLHREISQEAYKLRLQLNVKVDPPSISAKSNEGILTITLPVAAEALPRQIKIY